MRRGLLNRAVEFLPDDAAIAERTRRGQFLTRPELAVLLAYAKLTLYDDLLVTSVPDDPCLARRLSEYFPREFFGWARYLAPEAKVTRSNRVAIVPLFIISFMRIEGGVRR